jgi:hypothetical protein
MCQMKSEDLKKFTLEELIKWRNTASQRVTKADNDLDYLYKVIQGEMSKFRKIEKKKLKDIYWIKKLNRVLECRVFKERN